MSHTIDLWTMPYLLLTLALCITYYWPWPLCYYWPESRGKVFFSFFLTGKYNVVGHICEMSHMMLYVPSFAGAVALYCKDFKMVIWNEKRIKGSVEVEKCTYLCFRTSSWSFLSKECRGCTFLCFFSWFTCFAHRVFCFFLQSYVKKKWGRGVLFNTDPLLTNDLCTLTSINWLCHLL